MEQPNGFVQTAIPFDHGGWPPQDRFPVNANGSTVGDVVLRDVRAACDPLIITGFTGLPMLIDLLAHYASRRATMQRVRILIGAEPNLPERPLLHRQTARIPVIHDAIAQYWLERGVSLEQSIAVVTALDFLDDPHVVVEVRSSPPQRPIHAKLYVADTSVTLGSSNLSRAGMATQIEANERHTPADGDRYVEVRLLAEQIWAAGVPYRDRLVALLQQLLRPVTWREALARGCLELLDGAWIARTFPDLPPHEPSLPDLWPSQQAGIVQALWILETTGSVIIADAAGSGKTRMVAELLRRLTARAWQRGMAGIPRPVLIAPPRIMEQWAEQAAVAGIGIERIASTQLSRAAMTDADRHRLRHAQILVIDEAHGFLNALSRRTQQVIQAAPVSTILLTATPLNRALDDLIAMVNLLGPDQFPDEVLAIVERAITLIRTAPDETAIEHLHDDEIRQIRAAISHMMVRRTRSQLNALIDRDPDAYRNRFGRRCRFPDVRARFYPTAETDADQAIMLAIRQECDQLVGVVPLVAIAQGLARRGHASLPLGDWGNWISLLARGLAIGHIHRGIRSSRVAGLAHCIGRTAAWQAIWGDDPPWGLPHERYPDGMYGVLSELLVADPPPLPTWVQPYVPSWMLNIQAWHTVVAAEAARYQRITDLLRQLSDAREEGKAAFVCDQLQRHALVIAFDYRPVTIADLERRIRRRDPDVTVLATYRPGDEREVLRRFRIGSTDRNTIALCTDAMAESVNLQAASCLVHLDMPTTVRVLEQRDGRINRMDSDHPIVETWLPKDTPPFGPRTRTGEERIMTRMRAVRRLLGANVLMPDEVAAAEDPSEPEAETPETMVAAWRQRQQAREDESAPPDALAPIRGLIDGDAALIDRAWYEQVRCALSGVRTVLAGVTSHTRWAWYCVTDAMHETPRWVMVVPDRDGGDGWQMLVSLEEICAWIRRVGEEDPPSRPIDGAVARVIRETLSVVRKGEGMLLSPRRRRALEQLRDLCQKWAVHARTRTSRQQAVLAERIARGEAARQVLQLLDRMVHPDDEGRSLNLSVVADRWLARIQPRLLARTARLRSGLATVRSLDRALQADPPSAADLWQIIHDDGTLWAPDTSTRIVAAIIGTPD